MSGANRTVNVLGSRGIPAAYGGFETFAAQLAPYLRDQGWTVNVYCQIETAGSGALPSDHTDDYHGIHRINIASRPGPLGSLAYDWRCVMDARRRGGVNLVLGYNTAVFSLLLRLGGRSVAMNMDGVEWKRAKWSLPIKAWFYLNEFAGAHLANIPIADHPEIARHLRRHGCTRAEMIPYGASTISEASNAPLIALGLAPGQYFVSIARIEPENSILEIVQAFSLRSRSCKLVVLGRLDASNAYHMAVQQAASANVLFPGAIYDQAKVAALRFHCRAHLHGHQVGGTNPSLVAALGASNAVIAHDNRFNRWVAGDEQFYFADRAALDVILSGMERGTFPTEAAKQAAGRRHHNHFALDAINQRYQTVLERLV